MYKTFVNYTSIKLKLVVMWKGIWNKELCMMQIKSAQAFPKSFF